MTGRTVESRAATRSNDVIKPVPIRHRILPLLRKKYDSTLTTNMVQTPASDQQPIPAVTAKIVVTPILTSTPLATPPSPPSPSPPTSLTIVPSATPTIRTALPPTPSTKRSDNNEEPAKDRFPAGRQLVVVQKKKQLSSVPWDVPVVLPQGPMTGHRSANPWIVASFDIGIKTLSYCILSRDPSKPTGSGEAYTIYDWDIINLMPSQTQSLVCTYQLGSGKRQGQPCGKKASFVISPKAKVVEKSGNNNAKEDNEGNEDREDDEEDEEDEEDEACDEGDSSVALKGLCRVHAKKVKDKDVIRERRVDNMSNMEMNIEIVRALDKRPIFLEVDEILLEHQPSKNPRMKNLSYMLHSYFVMRGLIDKPSRCPQAARLQSIRFISPKNKLNIYDGPQVAQKYKRPYDENKYRSKVYTEYLIREDPEKLAYFKGSHKKRDDLGDAFLQGAWYLRKIRK